MLRVAVRGLSLILGLGLLVGGVWGPQFKPDALVAAVALIMSATLSSIRLQQIWLLSLLLAGIVCLLIRITIVIIVTPDTLEMALQLTVLILCTLLLGQTVIREGKARLQSAGWL
jgi:hypothetical protein